MNLPKLLGCLEPVEKPVEIFRVNGEQSPIFRCPRALLTGPLLEILDLAATGYLSKLTPAEVRRLPAGLVASVEWVANLLEERRNV